MRILFFVAAVLIAVFPVLAARAACAADTARCRLGAFEVGMIYERQGKGKTDILVNADPADVEKFIPEDGPESAVAVCVVKTPDDTVLFDTGFGTNVVSGLAKLGIAPTDVTKIMITHAHGDHIGGLVKDGDPVFPNATVFISRSEYDWSAAGRDALTKYETIKLIDPEPLDAPGKELAPGIVPIAAYGHTPGHTVFKIASGGDELIIWGDLTHVMQLQMPRPRVAVSYDTDKTDAVRVRLELLDHIAKSGAYACGMHVPFPGVGKLTADPENKGGYVFTPAEMESVE